MHGELMSGWVHMSAEMSQSEWVDDERLKSMSKWMED